MDLKSLVAKVTQFTIDNPNERDCWEKAPAITGVLTWGEKKSVEAVTRWLDRAVATQKSDGNFSYTDASFSMLGHIRTQTPTAALPSSIGHPLMMRYKETKNKAYLEAAARQMQGLYDSPRTREGGIWARKEGPELWIDYLYLMCPFMIMYGQITGEQKHIDEAFKQFDVHVKRLVDPFEHLSRHAWCEKPNHYPQSTFWLRGNCWLVCACVELVALAPSHPAIPKVRQVCADTLKAMAKYHDRCGYFYHILDDETSNFEASGTLMYAYAVARAIEQGIVPESMRESAIRAFNVVAGSVEPSGKVPGVAVPPGGPGVPFDWTLFGQGFFLLAAHALQKHLE
jgi:unsaturated rhamnogalacturonyl hydrolase